MTCCALAENNFTIVLARRQHPIVVVGQVDKMPGTMEEHVTDVWLNSGS